MNEMRMMLLPWCFYVFHLNPDDCETGERIMSKTGDDDGVWKVAEEEVDHLERYYQ